ARGEDHPLREGVAVEYHSRHWGERLMPLRAWRTPDWKYVEAIGGDDELYDLREDPAETRNLAEEPEHAGQKARLRDGLYAWTRDSGDPWPEVVQPDNHVELPEGPWQKLADGQT
ncbi:MAG: hypothetical protein QGI83_22835, partial [Candidatus Latescibacteria bacterium]|nr:hypothetical protein [Candidatus Latescibacterota bacterium]